MIQLDRFLSNLKPRFDDDIIDRLNNYYTPMLLVMFSMTMAAKQYVGQPIQCWVPAQFTGAWEQYSENYCFVQNTYFLPLRQQIPNDYADRTDREIGYYQWVPFVLALQAIMFYLPSMIWRMLNWQSGLAVKGVVEMAQDVKNMEKENREKNVEVVAAHLFDSLRMQHELKSRNPIAHYLLHGSHYGSYVSGLYLVIKLVYFVQVICQFFILNQFLGTSYTFWGFEILRDLANGREWQESGHFPRVTMCDFDVRVLGNLHRWTVQCVLMINMFNEKIFLFLWWWFLLVAVCTGVSLIYWLLMTVSKPSARGFITKYLRVSDAVGNSDDEAAAVSKFVNRVLRPDGVFVVRMISKNAGDLITTDIVHELWVRFLKRQKAYAAPIPELLKASPGKSSGNSSGIPDDDGGIYEPDAVPEKTPLKEDQFD